MQDTVRRLSAALKWIITAVLVVNILAVVVIPRLVELGYANSEGIVLALGRPFAFTPPKVLRAYPAIYGGATDLVVLAVFLQVSGCFTAVILVQARAVLHNLSNLMPFHRNNAGYMWRAGAAFLLIAVAALVRTLWGLTVYSVRMLFTYNTLFIPVFTVAGLLCFVMAALFSEAASLKEDNDLVI